MLKEKERSEERHIQEYQEFAGTLWDFLKLLEDMEKRGETVRTISGSVGRPFGSKATYNYSVKLGIEDGDFPLKRGFHPRPRPVAHVRSIKGGTAKPGPEPVRPDDIESQELVVDLFDEGDCISVVAQVPYVKEEDVDIKIVDNTLKITAITPEGRIEKDIPVSSGSRIAGANFRNGVLEIGLSKREVR